MNYFKKLFLWTLLIIFGFNTFFISYLLPAKALDNQSSGPYNPTLHLTGGISKITNDGDKYAELWLDWTPAQDTPSGNYKWIVNIYDTTTIKDTKNAPHVLESDPYNYGVREHVYKHQDSNGSWVGWNKSFTVILTLRDNNDKDIGQDEASIDMGPAPTGNSGKNQVSGCGIKGLVWYPTAQKEFIHFSGSWDTSQCPSNVKVSMTRGDKTTADYGTKATTESFFVIDTAPTSGQYTFTMRDVTNDKEIGTTTIEVDLSKATVPSDQGPVTPPTHDYNSINSAGNDRCSTSESTILGVHNYFDVGGNIGYAMCKAEEWLMNQISYILCLVANGVLIPALWLDPGRRPNCGNTNNSSTTVTP